MKDLEVMMINAISSAFETIGTVEQGVELLDIFMHLQVREVCSVYTTIKITHRWEVGGIPIPISLDREVNEHHLSITITHGGGTKHLCSHYNNAGQRWEAFTLPLQ